MDLESNVMDIFLRIIIDTDDHSISTNSNKDII